MMIVWIINLFTTCTGKMFCTSAECDSCISGYINFEGVSCLSFCPTGYYLEGSSFKPGQSQELFVLNFFSYRKFEGNTIETFAHPQLYSFSSASHETPIPLVDRGFYFFSNSQLVSNTSWVLGPRFCMGIYVKTMGAGTIFKIADGSKIYFELAYNGNYKFSFLYTDGVNENMHVSEWSYPNYWAMFVFLVYQYEYGFYYYYYGLSAWTYIASIEFRMDSQSAKYTIGSSTNQGFQGFIGYLCLKNSYFCLWKYLPVNDCLYNQYYDYLGCHDCNCASNAYCTGASCQRCHPSSCTSCKGYSFESCEQFSSTPNLGKNCITGSGLICTVCTSGYTLSNGLCVSPSNFSTLTLRFDLFSQYKGEFFKSGVNPLTYSPWNNPESDDPIALSLRGHWFYTNQFFISSDLTLNHSFTISVWITAGSVWVIYSNKLYFTYDASLILPLSNSEKSYMEVANGECYSELWRFFAVIVNYTDGSTHFTSVCGQSIKSTFSVKGFAFYDIPGPLKISPMDGSYNFIYRMTISQFANFDFNSDQIICQVAGSASCLAYPNQNFLSSSGRLTLCDTSCSSGCKAWGTCNMCSKPRCRTCNDFVETCEEDLSYEPCFSGFRLADDGQRCCQQRCSLCYGQTAYMCLQCAPGFVLVGSLCTQNCPSLFVLSNGVCQSPGNLFLLDVTFDKIADSFTDSLNNTFFTGSTQEFYPNLTQSDPIPAKSRGFYFTGISFVDTSEFAIPNNFSISFWVRQTSSGVLMTKNNLGFTSGIFFEYGSFNMIVSRVYSGIWVVVNFIGYNYFDYYFFVFHDSLGGYNYQYPDIPFDDAPSSIRFGSDSAGFVGFIWRVFIYSGLHYASQPVICTQSTENNCLWNCDLNYFFSGSSCSSCSNSCLKGCIRTSDCNLCEDQKCYECEDFTSQCKTCILNSWKSAECECNPFFYWNSTERKCSSCKANCLNCTSDQNCFECQENFILNVSECLCKDGFYLESEICNPCNETCATCTGLARNNCSSCFEYQSLVNGSCICHPGRFWNGSKCETCNENCLECSGGSEVECTACEERAFLNGSQCLCKDGFYKDQNQCLQCFFNCERCFGPSSQECLCEYDGGWQRCKCPDGQFWDGRCIECDSNCFTCFGFDYFRCESCKGYLLDGICFEKCPRGYAAEKNKCKVKVSLALRLSFKLEYPLIDEISRKSASLCKYKSENNPFVLPLRGIYFPENSDCIKFESKPYPLISWVFTIVAWLKLKQDSVIFSINSSELFNLKYEENTKISLILSINGLREGFSFETSFNISNWHRVLISLSNDSSYFIYTKLNNIEYPKVTLPFFPYKDSSNSVLVLGDDAVGFFYLFEIFTSLTEDIQDSFPSCPEQICPIECDAQEFIFNETCQKCPNDCKYGCENATTCIICSEKSCLLCNNLLPDICEKCPSPFVLEKSKCVPCQDDEFYEYVSGECVKCPSLCTRCIDDKKCEVCVENSSIPSELLCECDFGYKENKGKCSRLSFNVSVKIDDSNIVSIKFDQLLKTELLKDHVKFYINSKITDASLKLEQKTSIYSADVEVPTELKNEKKRNLRIEFNSDIESIKGALLTQTIFNFKMFDQEDIVIAESLANLQKSGTVITTAAAAAALTSGAFLLNPTIIFNLLSLVEMFSYALLYDVQFHKKFIDFLVSLKKSSKLPMFNVPIKSEDTSMPKKYFIYGIESSLLTMNAGYLIIFIVAILILTSILYVMTFSTGQIIKSTSEKLLKFIFYGWFHRSCIQSSFDLSLFSLLSLRYSEFDTAYKIFDLVVCCLLIVIFMQVYFGVWVFINLYYLLKSKFPMTNVDVKDALKNYSAIFEEFDCTNWNYCCFYLIFVARRFCLSVMIIFSNGVFQLMSSISFCFAIIFYLIYLKPLAQKQENFFILINECFLLVFYATITLNELNLIQIGSERVAVISIRIIIGTLGFNVIANVIKMIIHFYQKLRSRWHTERIRVAPQISITSIYQSSISKVRTDN